MIKSAGATVVFRAAKARKSSRDYPGAMLHEGDCRSIIGPWSGLQPAGSRSESCVHLAGSALPFFKRKEVQIERNFAALTSVFCLLYSYLPAGLANFAASIATFACTSLRSMVDCPSVQVATQ
jgi:hypothetical protein